MKEEYEGDSEFYNAYWDRTRFRALEVSKNLKRLEFKRLIGTHVHPGGDVLDVGCGTGDLAATLKSRYRITAFDFSEKTIQRNQFRITGVRFLCRNVLDPPPNNEVEKFDAVTCMDVIEHLPFEKQGALIRNVASYLKLGGILVISTPDRDQALRYKVNPKQTDEDFLKQYEGQPRADCLTKKEFENLLQGTFRIKCRSAVSPTVTRRSIDLLWKVFAVTVGYRGVNIITNRFGIPARYIIRAAIKVR